jgi:hypothetical protein
MLVMRSSSTILPKHGSAMGTYVELIFEVNVRTGIDTTTLRIKTPVSWKFELRQLLAKLRNSIDQIDLVLSTYIRPALV